MSYFIYTELICSLLDPRLVDPGSALIYVGAYGPKSPWLLKYSIKYHKWNYSALVLGNSESVSFPQQQPVDSSAVGFRVAKH